MNDRPEANGLAPQDWIEALDRAEAELAAGKIGTPWPEIRARLIARIEKAEAERARHKA